MLAFADDAALARLVIAATRIRTYRGRQWLTTSEPEADDRGGSTSCPPWTWRLHARGAVSLPLRTSHGRGVWQSPSDGGNCWLHSAALVAFRQGLNGSPSA